MPSKLYPTTSEGEETGMYSKRSDESHSRDPHPSQDLEGV